MSAELRCSECGTTGIEGGTVSASTMRIADALKVRHGDELEWELLPAGDRIIAKVRKAEKPK